MSSAFGRVCAFFFFGLTSFSGCSSAASPEDAVRGVLVDAVASLEKGSISQAADYLSERYRDEAGRDKVFMKRLAVFALRQGKVMISLRETQIEVQEKTARVQTAAYALQTAEKVERVDDLIPKNAKKFQLTISLHKEGKRWRVTSIDGDGVGRAGM